MKKGIAAISFLLYFAATTGIVINSHFCMKKLVSVKLFGKKPKLCSQCGMDMHNASGCCHDETKVVKLEQDHQKIPVIIYEIPTVEPAVMIVSDLLLAPLVRNDQHLHFHNHSPPLLSAQDTYLQNNVFRI